MAEIRPALSLRLAQAAFLLFTFSLVFMQPSFVLGGPRVTAADALFLLTFGLWLAALAQGTARFRWHPFFWLLLLYFAAMLLSSIFSPDPRTSILKLAGEAYLLSLPILTLSLVEKVGDLRRIILCWLGATALLALIAACSILTFFWRPDHPLLDYTLFGFGSLPEGPYPRLRLTFENANMLCHFLSISMMLTLVSHHIGWIGRRTFRFLLAAILATAAFTISPGLGAIALCLGLWIWSALREQRPSLAFAALMAGTFASLAFLAATMIAPQIHSTAPFLLEIPILNVVIAPSGRIMTWWDSLQTFLAHPIFGHGLGLGAASVLYLAPTGGMQHLTDAHNLFLNVAAESGVAGLVAVLLIAAWFVRASLPLSLDGAQASALRLGLGLALVGAFLYQGLAGSFEDARHLWVLIGLFLAAGRLADRGERTNTGELTAS